MPKLPAVRSRQSCVSGQTSPVAGALIPNRGGMSEDEVDNFRRIAMQLCEAFEPPQPLLEYQQAPLSYRFLKHVDQSV